MNQAATSISELPGRGIKPLVSLKAHLKVALVAFVVITLLGLPVVFLKGKPNFIATALIQVSPTYMKNLRDDGELSFPSNTQYRQFVENQAKSVLRFDIVQDGLRSLKEKGDVWRKPGKSERDAINMLQNIISVRTIPDTYLMEVTISNTEAAGIADIVNAIVTTYVDRMKYERVYGSDIRQQNLEKRSEELLNSIADYTDRRTNLALKLGISTFGQQVDNPYDKVLSEQRSALTDARNKRIEAEAQLQAFQKYGETDINTRSVQEAVLIDPGLSNLKANLYKRRADILTQLAGLTPQHPGYSELNKELKQIDKEIEKQIKSLTQSITANLLSRYENSVRQSRTVEEKMAADLSDLEQKGSEFANIYNQVMELTHHIQQDRNEFDVIRERLNTFAAEENSFGFVRMVTPALPPEQSFGTSKKKLLVMVMVLALAASLTLPILLDMLDKRINTVNDAERILGIGSLGWMIEKTTRPTEMFGEDLIRRMASGLIHQQNDHQSRVFAFSAIKPGAGTSELVMMLGKTLDSLGFPTLVIEANAFKPDVRFNPSHEKKAGLAECIHQQLDPSTVITLADSTYPDRLWIGQTEQTRHLDCINQINTVTQSCLDCYKFILVDTPPLLLSADTELLAQELQNLVLVVEAGATSRGELKRAGRLVEKVNPAAVGVVVNRIRPFQGGGYLTEAMHEYLTGQKYQKPFFTTGLWSTMKQWFRHDEENTHRT